jgi:hypothetical protein
MAPPQREPDITSPDGSQPVEGELGSTLSTTQQRKVEHIRINLEEDVQSKGISSGLDRYRLVPTKLTRHPHSSDTSYERRFSFRA